MTKPEKMVRVVICAMREQAVECEVEVPEDLWVAYQESKADYGDEMTDWIDDFDAENEPWKLEDVVLAQPKKATP